MTSPYFAHPKPPARVTRRERLGNPRERCPVHVRAAVWARDRGLCAWCGEADAHWEAHRVLPGARGGRYTVKNVITLCRRCHRETFAGMAGSAAEARARAKGERLAAARAALRRGMAAKASADALERLRAEYPASLDKLARLRAAHEG